MFITLAKGSISYDSTVITKIIAEIAMLKDGARNTST